MDAAAFTTWIRAHAGAIHRVARTYGRDAAECDDLAQEIVLQLWRSRGRYEEGRPAATWIFRVALNVAISFQRRERRHHLRRTEEGAPLLGVAGPAPAEASVELERLQRCIDALGPLEKALVLLYLEGHDHAAIAEVLGISVSNVGTKLQRTKERLRDALERRARTEERPHATR